MTTKRVIFDANSTSPTSGVYCIPQGECVQLRAWNLGATDEVTVELVRLSDAVLGKNQSSCDPVTPGQAAQILDVAPYAPCGYQQFLIDSTRNAVVIQAAGCYRFQLTPAALGTAVVELIFAEGEGCAQMAAECCCQPEIPWLGVSTNPCLTITPGGPAGHSPVFDLDACCLLQALPANPNPQLTDRLVFLSGPDCFTATIDEVFSQAVVCDSLGEFGIGAYAAGDTLVALDAGENCKRLDIQAAVTATETPWTGTSNNVNLTITPGGVNGHAPIFDYDLCADIQATPVCGCTPTTGDLVLIVQAGACVLATWPATDLCEQIGLLPLGGVLPDDRIPVREAGGACKYLPASAFLGGGVVFPLLAPDGTCAAPSYSFASDTDTGMFFDPASPVLAGGGPAAVIGWDSCASRLDVGESIRLTAMNGDFIEVGASINIFAFDNDVRARGGNLNLDLGGNLRLNNAGVGFGGNAFFRGGDAEEALSDAGSADVGGGHAGAAAQHGGAASFFGGNADNAVGDGGIANLTGGNAAGAGAGGYVFVSAGGSATGIAGNVVLTAGASAGGTSGELWLRTGTVITNRLVITALGEWNVSAGGVGAAGEVITSQGAGLTPVWAAIGSSPILAADGSCAAPAYSFASDTDSGMFLDTGTAVVIGWDNCSSTVEVGDIVHIEGANGDTLDVGASIVAQSVAGSRISLDSGADSPNAIFIRASDAAIFRHIEVRAGNNIGGIGVGGNLNLAAGDCDTGSTAGSVNIVAGTELGAGTPGSINFGLSGEASGPTLIKPIGGASTGFNLVMGVIGGTVATSVTDGFIHIQGMNGAPIGVPTLYASEKVPITYDISTDCIYAYNGGWVPFCSTPAFPLMAPDGSCAAPSYSFTSSPDSGMWYDPGGAGSVVISDDNCVDSIAIGASITFNTALTPRFVISNSGEWLIPGSAGVAGQAIVSNGPGTPPTWQTPAGVAEPITQMVYGTGPAVDSSPFFFWNVATGQLNLNINAGATPLSVGGGGSFPVTIRGSDRTGGRGSDVFVLGGDGSGGFNDGGHVEVRGGRTSDPGRFGGNASLIGGTPFGAATGATGGQAFMQSGDAGDTTGMSGSVKIFMGDPGAAVANQTSAIIISRIDGQGGGLYIPGSNNSHVVLLGNDARYAAAPQGQSVTIESGSGGTGAVVNAPSGNVILSIGRPHGTGAVGVIRFAGARDPVAGVILPLGNITAKGDFVLAGYGNGTNGGEYTPVPAAQTTGFVWLPRIAASPINPPAGTEIPSGTGYANPTIIEQVSAAETALWAYNFAAAAWHRTSFGASGAIAAVALNEVANTNANATRTHNNQIIWNWGNPGAGTAAFQHGLASASTTAELLRLDVTEPANSNVYALRVTWTGGGEFALRTGAVTDAVLLKGADTVGQEIRIEGGDGPGGVNGGGVTIEGGDGGINTGGGVTTLAGNGTQGGAFRGQGGNSAGTGLVGGDAQLIGGDSTNVAVSAAARGGSVFIRGGDCDAGGAASTTQWGNVYLNADGTFPLVAAAATSGFVYLPRVAGPPVGTPAVLPATGTFAMVVENTSPTLTLWMYDPVGGAWRSVVLV